MTQALALVAGSNGVVGYRIARYLDRHGWRVAGLSRSAPPRGARFRHIAVDLTKVAGIRGMAFNDADLITCFANDYGYEHWMAQAVRAYAGSGDTLVLISSSGRSPSVLNAATEANRMGIPVLTLTGFAPDNPLRASGTVNLWVNDRRYNMVEATHQAWLVAMVDALAGIPVEAAAADVFQGATR